MRGIYKITNPVGAIYIGQSKNLEKRKTYYTPGRCKNQIKINNSLKKYGYKNHIFEIIHLLKEDENEDLLNYYEKYYYDYYKNLGFNLLNLKECGFGGGKHSKETLKKISISSKNRFKQKEGNKILQYDISLNLINSWSDSILDISKKLNFLTSGITRSLKANSSGKFKIAYNYFWIYEKDIDLLKHVNPFKIKCKTNQYGKHYEYNNRL